MNNRFYRGGSMRGTFCPGDYLHIEQIQLADIRAGDVIIFRDLKNSGNSISPEDEKEMVHRVIKITPKRIITRGDNNLYIDDIAVKEDNLKGRVTRFERYGKKRAVQGGYGGLVKAKSRFFIIYLWKLIKKILGPFYRLMRRLGLARLFWHPEIEKVNFSTENGPLVKYICGDKTVAKFWPESGSFTCRKPYDLILIKQLKA